MVSVYNNTRDCRLRIIITMIHNYKTAFFYLVDYKTEFSLYKGNLSYYLLIYIN